MKKTLFKQKPNKKWSRRDIIMLLERLEMYLSSGLEIGRALAIVEEGLSQKQQASIRVLSKAVESGGSLSKNLMEQIGISETTAGLIEHGEYSGSLPQSLFAARALLEKEDELFKKCASAMAYPVVIGAFASLLTIGLVRGVMPQIIPMLTSLHVKLPFITVVVIFFSEVITKWGLYILLSLIVVTFAFRFALKNILPVRRLSHETVLNIPIIGRLFFDYYLAVFLHSCGSLVESGLPVKDAFSDTAGTIALIPLRRFLQDRAPNISQGLSFGSVIANATIVHKKMPAFVAPLLNAGEASGTLGLSIIRAGNILDRDIDHSLKKLTALIEPIMMISMGCAVGSIAMAIMMPIYSLSSALQNK